MQGRGKGLPGRIAADVGLWMQIVPEKDPIHTNDLIEGFPDVFILVDIGEHDDFMDGDFRVPHVLRLFRDQAAILPDFVHKFAAVGFRLFQGAFPLFVAAVDGQCKILRVCFTDLLKCPVLDFENNEAVVFAEEDEIGFAVVDVRQVPDQVIAIRFGNGLQETIEPALAVSREVFNIRWNHYGHFAVTRGKNRQ